MNYWETDDFNISRMRAQCFSWQLVPVFLPYHLHGTDAHLKPYHLSDCIFLKNQLITKSMGINMLKLFIFRPL